MSGTPRPSGLPLPKLQVRIGQVMGEDALVKAVILVAKARNIPKNNIFLVGRARKVIRKAATGDVRLDLKKFGILAGCATPVTTSGTATVVI